MFTEAQSAEELAQLALDELTDLETKLGTDSAESDWDTYLDSFDSRTILEPSSTMMEECGKRFEGIRFASKDEQLIIVYVYFDGKSKNLSVASSHEYTNHLIDISNLPNVELRFEALTSGSISA